MTQDGYVPPTCTFDVTPGSISGGAEVPLAVLPSRQPIRLTWAASSDAAGPPSTRRRWDTGEVLSDGALGYWRLNEVSTSAIVADLTGRGQTGFLQGGITLQQTGAVSGDAATTLDGTGRSRLANQPP